MARLTRDERKAMIEAKLMLGVVNGEIYRTVSQIARQQKLKPSTHLRNMLWEMVEEKRLEGLFSEYRGKWVFGLRADRYEALWGAERGLVG